MNVLIADDNASLVKVLHAQLAMKGHAVFDAYDGVEAMAMLDRQPVDAVVTDILMPRMDGYRLCFEIRNNPRYSALPIVVYSATYTTSQDETVALQAGANQFLRKPASIEVICEALQSAMADGRSRTAPVEADHEIGILRAYNERLVSKLEERGTQLERQNEALILTQERYRDLLESTSDLTQTVSLDGRLLHVNGAWKSALGYADDEVHSLKLFSIIHPDDRVRWRTMWTGVSAGSSADGEVRMIRKDGRSLVVQANVKPILADGVPVSVRCIFRDITKETEAVEDQRRLGSRLSHHLRTPLNGIIGLANIIASDQAMALAEVRDLVGLIRSSGLRLEGGVNRLLELVELSGLGDGEPHANADVFEVTRRVATARAVDAGRLDDLELAVAPGAIRMSNYWLEHLVAAIVDNAFLYSSPGSKVNVRTQFAMGALTMVIEDAGRGMSQSDADGYLQLRPLVQSAADTDRLGMGLVVAARAAAAHGGTLSIASTIGQGTTVTVVFPR